MTVHLVSSPAATDPLAGSTQERVRVLAADHDGLARRSLHDALHKAEGLVAIATAGDAREAEELSRYYRPGVLIVDVALPPRGCLEVIDKVRAAAPETRILTVSAEEDDEMVLAALRAGASGHASKDLDPEELARLVRLVAQGEAIIPRRLSMPVLNLLREVPDAGWRPLRSRLTTREWEIVELLAADASTELIAERLVLSSTTVYSHIKSVFRKLDVHSRGEAVAVADQLRREEALGINTPNGVQ